MKQLGELTNFSQAGENRVTPANFRFWMFICALASMVIASVQARKRMARGEEPILGYLF